MEKVIEYVLDMVVEFIPIPIFIALLYQLTFGGGMEAVITVFSVWLFG